MSLDTYVPRTNRGDEGCSDSRNYFLNFSVGGAHSEQGLPTAVPLIMQCLLQHDSVACNLDALPCPFMSVDMYIVQHSTSSRLHVDVLALTHTPYDMTPSQTGTIHTDTETHSLCSDHEVNLTASRQKGQEYRLEYSKTSECSFRDLA